jgi:hypothetical protein
VIAKVGIPVPSTIAFNEDQHMAQKLINAIKDQVKLHKAASSLVLDASQEHGLSTSLATIVGNYLSHWSTGQVQAFTPTMLLGVMQAIDDFAACFQFEHPAGSGDFRYYAALDKKL